MTPEQYAIVKAASTWAAANECPITRFSWGVFPTATGRGWEHRGCCCPLGATLLRHGPPPGPTAAHVPSTPARLAAIEAVLGPSASPARVAAFMNGFDDACTARFESDACPPALKAWHEAGVRMRAELEAEGLL